jgi:AraC family transcriptional regulator
MQGVCSQWASISLRPELLDGFEGARRRRGQGSFVLAPFSNVADPFVASLAAELARLHAAEGRLDETYCEAMSHALIRYLACRYGREQTPADHPGAEKLPPWRVRRIADYIEAHLAEGILVSDLAAVVGVSTGHLHRAFRRTIGSTPLAYINERRVRRAMSLMDGEQLSVAEVALRVGFLSPSHFTRTFRRIAGLNPSHYERGAAYRGSSASRSR